MFDNILYHYKNGKQCNYKHETDSVLKQRLLERLSKKIIMLLHKIFVFFVMIICMKTKRYKSYFIEKLKI